MSFSLLSLRALVLTSLLFLAQVGRSTPKEPGECSLSFSISIKGRTPRQIVVLNDIHSRASANGRLVLWKPPVGRAVRVVVLSEDDTSEAQKLADPNSVIAIHEQPTRFAKAVYQVTRPLAIALTIAGPIVGAVIGVRNGYYDPNFSSTVAVVSQELFYGALGSGLGGIAGLWAAWLSLSPHAAILQAASYDARLDTSKDAIFSIQRQDPDVITYLALHNDRDLSSQERDQKVDQLLEKLSLTSTIPISSDNFAREGFDVKQLVSDSPEQRLDYADFIFHAENTGREFDQIAPIADEPSVLLSEYDGNRTNASGERKSTELERAAKKLESETGLYISADRVIAEGGQVFAVYNRTAKNGDRVYRHDNTLVGFMVRHIGSSEYHLYLPLADNDDLKKQFVTFFAKRFHAIE